VGKDAFGVNVVDDIVHDPLDSRACDAAHAPVISAINTHGAQAGGAKWRFFEPGQPTSDPTITLGAVKPPADFLKALIKRVVAAV
jgi:hypothetical protein